MNEENSSASNFDVEPEEELENTEQHSAASQSRARNRTVMLTPEMTGQVRALLHDEVTAVVVEDDFVRPGQPGNKAKDDGVTASFKVPSDPEKPLGAGLTGTGLGLKFGKSENRSETAKISRDEIDDVISAEQEPGQPEPVVQQPVKFDPLTTLAPSNFESILSQAQKPSRPEAAESEFLRPQPALREEPSAQVHQPVRVEEPPVVEALPQVEKAPPKSQLIGFLVSYDESEFGEFFEIRAGRKLITSRPTEHGEYLLIEHETISPLHAILRATKDGKLQVLDQLSEHGTAVLREGQEEEIEVAGGLESVFNGDIVRFGERSFQVCLVPKKK